ncbi:hypothetical protein [Nocardia heshunensis]
MTDRLVEIATETLARRWGAAADAPESHIAAIALIGLWRIQSRSLDVHLKGNRAIAKIEQAVNADVKRAAHLLEAGISSTV